MRRECRKILRPGRWSHPSARCHAEADSVLLAVRPDGSRVCHGQWCRKHAEEMRSRYDHPATMVVETVVIEGSRP